MKEIMQQLIECDHEVTNSTYMYMCINISV